MAEYLDLVDFLLIAEVVLETPADVIARFARLPLADSALHAPAAEFDGVEFYPELAMKAAVLCVHLARNHPLPDGNKRCAFIAMLEFLHRNGVEWPYRAAEDDVVDVMEAVAAGSIDKQTLSEWLQAMADFPS